MLWIATITPIWQTLNLFKADQHIKYFWSLNFLQIIIINIYNPLVLSKFGRYFSYFIVSSIHYQIIKYCNTLFQSIFSTFLSVIEFSPSCEAAINVLMRILIYLIYSSFFKYGIWANIRYGTIKNRFYNKIYFLKYIREPNNLIHYFGPMSNILPSLIHNFMINTHLIYQLDGYFTFNLSTFD